MLINLEVYVYCIMGKMSSIKNVRTSKLTGLTGLTAFQTLLINKPAWGQYSASSWSGTTLTDLTGNGRNATTSANMALGSTTGNGATSTITSIGGTRTGTISWPVGSLPTTYCIASLTRYNTGTNQRVINGSSATIDFLQGHWNGGRGMVYANGWKQQSNTGTLLNWVGMVNTNSASVSAPNSVLIDGVASSTSNGGVGSGPTGVGLRINVATGTFDQPSDFEFSQLIIWDVVLTATEMSVVATALNTYLSTGILK